MTPPKPEKPKRREFTAKTKATVRERSTGLCEVHRVPRCMYPALPQSCNREGIEYDHITPATMGGSNKASNCALLCSVCHDIKTTTDNKEAKRSNRLRGETGQTKRRKARGYSSIPQPADPWNKRFKKKLSGEVVPR